MGFDCGVVKWQSAEEARKLVLQICSKCMRALPVMEHVSDISKGPGYRVAGNVEQPARTASWITVHSLRLGVWVSLPTMGRLSGNMDALSFLMPMHRVRYNLIGGFLT